MTHPVTMSPPPRWTPKHTRLCFAWARGLSLAEAGEFAGFGGDRSNAHKILKTPYARALVANIQSVRPDAPYGLDDEVATFKRSRSAKPVGRITTDHHFEKNSETSAAINVGTRAVLADQPGEPTTLALYGGDVALALVSLSPAECLALASDLLNAARQRVSEWLEPPSSADRVQQ